MTNVVQYSQHTLPSGRKGTRATLRLMSKIVKRYKTAPAIRELAIQLTNGLPPKKWIAEVQSIHRYVKNGIRYTRDIRGSETLQTPIQTLRLRAGDCDDHAMLVAALLESIHHPTRFVAVGQLPGRFSHVYTETKIGSNWLPVETTEALPVGQAVPHQRVKMIEHN